MRKSKPSFKSMPSAAAILAAVWTCGNAPAAFVTWTGATGDWFVGTNWDTGNPAGDTATVSNGGTAQADAAVSITSLVLGSAFADGTSASGTAALGGDLTLFGPLRAGRAFGAASFASKLATTYVGCSRGTGR